MDTNSYQGYPTHLYGIKFDFSSAVLMLLIAIDAICNLCVIWREQLCELIDFFRRCSSITDLFPAFRPRLGSFHRLDHYASVCSYRQWGGSSASHVLIFRPHKPTTIWFWSSTHFWRSEKSNTLRQVCRSYLGGWDFKRVKDDATHTLHMLTCFLSVAGRRDVFGRIGGEPMMSKWLSPNEGCWQYTRYLDMRVIPPQIFSTGHAVPKRGG